MNHDNQNDVQLSTTPRDDAAVQTAESSAIERELTDGELASVAAGYMVKGHKEHRRTNKWDATPM